MVFVLISAATTFLTMKQSQKRGMLNQTPPDPDQPGAAAAQAMSKNMMYIAPFFALSGLYWQFGLVIYWVTTNVWTLGQQYFLFRRLPVVGSATVGASAVQAASGNSGATARNTTVKRTPARSGASGASSASAKTGTASNASAKTGTRAAAGTKSASTAKPWLRPNLRAQPRRPLRPSLRAQPSRRRRAAPATVAAPKPAVAKANANGEAANGSANGVGGVGGVLKRFGKKEEPQEVPVAPETKIVRQQPSRQTRSKRNTGKR